jgi:hypothetical protein
MYLLVGGAGKGETKKSLKSPKETDSSQDRWKGTGTLLLVFQLAV